MAVGHVQQYGVRHAQCAPFKEPLAIHAVVEVGDSEHGTLHGIG